MSLIQTIDADLTEALKNHNELVVSVLRALKSAIKNQEIDKMKELDDKEILAVIEKQAKQRQDSIEQFTKGNRPDLAKKEQEELEIIKKYLPEKLDRTQTEQIVTQTIQELNATSIKDMGQVMKEVLDKSNGQADGRLVSEIVKEKLL